MPQLSQRAAQIVQELLDEPHIQGRPIPVLTIVERASAYEIGNAVLDIVDAYGSPAHMQGKKENLDQWIR